MGITERHSKVRLRTMTAAKCSFPMWCVRVEDIKRMRPGEHLCHQELMKKGILVEWNAVTCGPCAFVSHQWSGWRHADPLFQKLEVVKSFIKRIECKKITSVHPRYIMHCNTTALIYGKIHITAPRSPPFIVPHCDS